jgi:hypothetical protein
MIAHGHGDVKFAHYALDLYPADSNHTIGSFARLLRDLEKPPAYSSGLLFENTGSTPLYEAVMDGKDVCLHSLPEPPSEPVIAKKLPPTLRVQLDNCAKDNKSRYVFAYWSLLVAKGIFKEVFVSFLLVGHTHDDIDASFGRWSMKLREEDFPTIPLLMKSYMDLENVPVIPHMIEEVPDFKAFIEPYIRSGAHRLIGHTKAQQFRFYMRDDGVPAMQYKLLCTTQDWSPPEGLLVWCVDADGKTMLPDGEPRPCKPIAMKNLEDILKGISGFIQYWESLKIADVGGSCWHRYGSWIHYWTRVRAALADLHQDSPHTLRHGFWPQTRIDVQASEASLLSNGEVREEFDMDDHYVGPASSRPPPSFRIAVDCHEGYMLILRPGDETYAKPVWVARALSNPNFVTSSPHFRQIQVEYYRPTARNEDVVRHYTGWDTNQHFRWKVDSEHGPSWVDTDSIFIAWKPRKNHSGSVSIPQKYITFAKDNLARIAEEATHVE